MSRPDPIQYAERLYGAIRAANFSPMSFLAFGNAVKEGVPMRNMPRIAAEPFMRIVGEMLDLEEETAQDQIVEGIVTGMPLPPAAPSPTPLAPEPTDPQRVILGETKTTPDSVRAVAASDLPPNNRRRGSKP